MDIAFLFKDLPPIIAFLWSIYFYIKHYTYKKLDEIILLVLIFSLVFFASNFTNLMGIISFDPYRPLSKFIGIIAILLLIFKLYIQKKNPLEDLITKIFLSFFIAILISFLGNDINYSHYFHYLRNFLYISLISLFFYYSIREKEHLKQIIHYFFILLLILTILVFLNFIFEFLQNLTNGELFIDKSILGDRKRLFFPNPNYLGFILLPFLCLSLFLKDLKHRVVFIFLGFFAIISTGSKAAILSSLLVYVLYVQYINKDSIKKFLIFFLLLIFAFILGSKIMINPEFNGFRILITKAAFNAYQENPINGIGYAQFRTKQWKYIDEQILKQENHEIKDVVISNIDKLSLEKKKEALLNINGFFNFLGLDDEGINDIASNKNFIELRNDMGIGVHSEKMTHNDLMSVISELGTIGIFVLIWIFKKLYVEYKKLFCIDQRIFFLSISILISTLIFSLFHNNLTTIFFWLAILNIFYLKKFKLKF